MTAYMLAPFWLSIVILVLVLSLVLYIILGMVAEAAGNLVRFTSIVYAFIRGTHDGENDD